MLVPPATNEVDFAREILQAREVHLAHESQFRYLFPDCAVGAMPRFGNLLDIPVYVDRGLSEDEQIIFNAGTHRETMQIRCAE